MTDCCEVVAERAAQRAPMLRGRVAKPARFALAECPGCGHRRAISRAALFDERMLRCSKCGAGRIPRVVERGG